MKEYYTSDIERLEPRIKAAEGAAKSELEAKLQIRQDQLRKIEPIKWHVSTQGLEDYEQIFTHCTVLWNDPYIVSLGSSYAQYIEGNISGHEVAHEFLALCEMILRESR